MRRPLPPILLTAAMAVLFATTAITPAAAWPSPTGSGKGGACHYGARQPITFTVHNHETGYLDSPATVVDADVTPGTLTAFTPASLPNTGQATATATATVPDGYSGPVKLTYTLRWAGKDGGDERSGVVVVKVKDCPPPCTTTTTAPPTTVAPTTTTTSPPETTTTVRPRTTSTAPPSTTTSTTTTTTTAPSTTAPPSSVVTAVAAAAVDEHPAPPPAAVAVTPQFTG